MSEIYKSNQNFQGNGVGWEYIQLSSNQWLSHIFIFILYLLFTCIHVSRITTNINNLQIQKMSRYDFFLLLSLLLLVPSLTTSPTPQKVQQLTPVKLTQAVMVNDFTLVYFYSTTCKYCQIFTPKFQQLAKLNAVSGVSYGKIDGPGYDVYSYPSVALFWKGIDMPIFYRKDREVAELLEFLKAHTKPLKPNLNKQQYQKLSQPQKTQGAIYFGPVPSPEVNLTTVLSLLQPYRPFGIFSANVSQPYLQIKGHQYMDFNIKELRRLMRVEFAARLWELEEEPWMRIHQQKDIGIVYVEGRANARKDVTEVLKKLALQNPDIVFLRLNPEQEQFKQAIDTLGVEPEQNILGVHRRYDVKFVADKPYTEQSLQQFITKVVNLSAPIYFRSEKTTHKQKLTISNFDQKVINDPKDILVFLYKEQDRIHAKFMDLFKYLTNKLKDNQNLSLLRCNLSKNEIQNKLGFQVKVTPSLVYYGHRMKDKPVHFLKSVISAQNVIEFIMENTTFDWEDSWGEL